ncbi:hypothetical protein GX51_04805 [Blastomyces parvus]|uniref:Pentatricopeptide repeat protein n=1 Tax=Blastomyces parvus TaxID=2060905 RepID=A0A2B7X022_9EURO|nr:hypothetical protein GX51_04805 [Blastomyces parvus]
MLRCSNVCARSTLATRLTGNGVSVLFSRLPRGLPAKHIALNRSEYRSISTSGFDRPSPRGAERAPRSRSDFPRRAPSWKKTGYKKPGVEDEEGVIPSPRGAERAPRSRSDFPRRAPSWKKTGYMKSDVKDEEGVAEDLAEDSKGGADGKLEPGEKRIWRPTVSKKAIDIELEWARDRVALSNRVKQILKKGDLEKAVTLVQTAQTRGYDCMVGWNELFDHELKNNNALSAFKLYNDMKKRARKPNTYTYTIMFRGLAHSTSNKAVQMARSIYKSLCSPNSGVKPTILHANAVLGVCSRHGDMDALWEVAGSLPERGEGAPDSRTFTIILNGIQARTANELKALNPRSQADGIGEKRAAAVRDGKKIWADVVRRWKMGEFVVDQPLVSAMGRLLLSGLRRRDCLDVFALLHQTMEVPLLEDVDAQLEAVRSWEQKKHTEQDIPKPAEGQQEASSESSPEPEKVSMDSDETNPVQNEESKQLSEEPEPLPEEPELASEESGLPGDEAEKLNEKPEPLSEAEEFKGLFNPVDLAEIRKTSQANKNARRPKIIRPIPTNDELSLVLAASRTIPNGIAIGRAYWDYFTSGPAKPTIKPDTHSFHEYLRLLRVARSSAETLRIINAMAPRAGMVERKTFVIAISCCSRDRKNPHVLETAARLVGIMDTALLQPEPEILSKYLELVRYGISEASVDESTPVLSRVSDTQTTEQLFKKRILDAIAALRPHVDKLISLLAYSTLSKHGKDVDDEGARIKAASERVAEGSWPFSRHYLPSFEESVYILRQAKQLHDLALKEKTLSAEERTVLTTENQHLKDILSPKH